jgi:thiol-disulfide isomerase/thioredoxin
MRHGLPLLIALAAIPGVDCTPPTRPAVQAATSLPLTPLVTLDGTATDLATVLHGRVAVVSFWATWCDACVSEIDALKRLEAQAGARIDAVVVSVAVGERRETVAAFARRVGLPYAQLVDESFRLADALGQERVPATLVINRSGRIVFRGGALDPAGLAAFRSALDAGQ